MATIEQQLDVVGLKFRWNKDLRGELAALVGRKAMMVELEREPENEYDQYAIMVVAPRGSFNLKDAKKGDRNGGMLGYLPRELAEIMAPKIDGGEIQVISAKLVELHAPDYNNGTMLVQIKKLT